MARKEKLTNKAYQVTICDVQTIKVYKLPGESGTIPAPEVYTQTIEIPFVCTSTEALTYLRENEEIHVKSYDRIIASVMSIRTEWQLRAMTVTQYYRGSWTVARADSLEGLRPKKSADNDGVEGAADDE